MQINQEEPQDLSSIRAQSEADQASPADSQPAAERSRTDWDLDSIIRELDRRI